MKKIFAFILMFLMIVLIFSMSGISSFAASENTDKKSITEVTSSGTKITLSQSDVRVFFYGKVISFNDFTIKMKLKAPKGERWGSFKLILGYTGVSSKQVHIYFSTERQDAVQVTAHFNKIYSGNFTNGPLEIPYSILEKDIFLRGKLIDDNTYLLDFNNGEYSFEFKTSRSLNLTKAISSKCYLGVGGTRNYIWDNDNSEKYSIFVKEIDGVLINDKDFLDISNFEYFTNDAEEETNNSSELNQSSNTSTVSSEVTSNSEKNSEVENMTTNSSNKNKEKISSNKDVKKNFFQKNVIFVSGTVLLIFCIAIFVVLILRKKSKS